MSFTMGFMIKSLQIDHHRRQDKLQPHSLGHQKPQAITQLDCHSQVMRNTGILESTVIHALSELSGCLPLNLEYRSKVFFSGHPWELQNVT